MPSVMISVKDIDQKCFSKCDLLMASGSVSFQRLNEHRPQVVDEEDEKDVMDEEGLLHHKPHDACLMDAESSLHQKPRDTGEDPEYIDLVWFEMR